ncbi:MAG: hypothetical protein ACRELY_08735, partial [Polyangiaceae bacterium]
MGGAIYACGGDDATGPTEETDASIDGTSSDAALLDRATADGQGRDSASSTDAGADAPFLPNAPFVCGASDCDLNNDAGCCEWFDSDAAIGGECLPAVDFADGATPCAGMGIVAGPVLCSRATDCEAPLHCLVAPIFSLTLGGCVDASPGSLFMACDPEHACTTGFRCDRFLCGPNE